MPEALVKGEAHFSRKDKRALLEKDLSKFDAVFREGYDKNYFERDIDSLYALFAIGHLVYGGTYNRVYFSIDEFRDKIAEHGAPLYDKIDAPISETYEMVPRWKRAVLFVLSPVFALIFVGLLALPFYWITLRYFQNVPRILVVLGVWLLLLCFSFIWALAFFQLIEGEVMDDRDEIMAENIIRIAEDNDYNSILITCGGNHRPGIATHLENQGWDVEQEYTESPIGQLLQSVYRVQLGLFNPKETISNLKTRLRR